MRRTDAHIDLALQFVSRMRLHQKQDVCQSAQIESGQSVEASNPEALMNVEGSCNAHIFSPDVDGTCGIR